MKTRILPLVLIIAVVIGIAAPCAGADNSALMQAFLNKILQDTPENRLTFLLFFKSYVVDDSGVDMMVEAVEKYQETDKGFLADVIRFCLRYTDKTSLKAALTSIKTVDPAVRRKYGDAYFDKKSRTVTADSRAALIYFINKAQDKYPGLDRLMSEDDITVGVIAYQLQAIKETNAGAPLLTDQSVGSDAFDIYRISAGLAERAKLYAGISGTSAWNDWLDRLNASLSADEKKMLRQIGGELGFYTPLKQVLDKESTGGGVAYDKGGLTVRFSPVSDSDVLGDAFKEGATFVEVAAYAGDSKQSFGKLEKPVTVAIPVDGGGVMAYRVEGEMLVPIKYSVCADGMVYIRIEQTGYYALAKRDKYFTDSDGWGSDYIESLYLRGIISGKAEGVFAPDDTIKREEFVKLIVELFDIKDDKAYANFSDVDRGAWYDSYVASAYKYGLINGIGDNRFGIGYDITRQDICKIIANVIAYRSITLPEGDAIVFRDAGGIADYAKDSVAKMQLAGIISGNDEGYFLPADNATRQEAAKIIHGVLEVYIKSTL